VFLVLDHSKDPGIGAQPEHHILGVQRWSNHDRADVHSVLLEALSPETICLTAQQILTGIGNHKLECPVVSGQQLLLCRFKILRLTEPHHGSLQRVAIDRVHHLARDSIFRRNTLGTKVGCDSKHQRK
jgi:hypothetical protein